MSNLLDAARQALEALDEIVTNARQYEAKAGEPVTWADRGAAAIDAARAALDAQPEPVATLHDDGCFTWKRDEFRRKYDRQHAGWRMDVYAAPPKREPLTFAQGQELLAIAIKHPTIYEEAAFRKGAKAAERAHGIGGSNE